MVHLPTTPSRPAQNMSTEYTPPNQQAVLTEFRKRLEFLKESYRFARKALRDDQIWFNESRRRLRRRVRTKRKAKVRGDRVHPEIEIVITHHARRIAAAEGREVSQRDANEAARIAVSLLKSRRGRPENRVLEHHVIGLMALVQNFSLKPVVARRHRNSVYDPHFAEGLSQIVPTVFHNIDPRITTTSLVNIVLKAKRRQDGSEPLFRDLFPFYGASFVEGEIKLRPGLHLKALELNISIYCP